ncbi:MAG: hypothetical protein HOV84_17525 [Streptomyces sp.]|nr:hypothetical protein [Streptomyces sp.]
MSPDEEASVRLLKDAYARWDGKPPVQVTITHGDMFALILACQAMLTHPAVTTGIKGQLEHIGRQFQETLADTPEIYALLEAGWDRRFDVGPED